MARRFKFESRLGDKTPKQIEELANEGIDIFNQTGIVPEDSPQSYAMAAMIRLGMERKAGTQYRDRYPRKHAEDEEQAA